MNFTKFSLIVVFSGLLFTSCKQTATEPTAEAKPSTEKSNIAAIQPETASFNIEGMTCAMGCAKTIEKELANLNGVQKATVDFDTKTATVEYDGTIQSTESLVKVVEATGDGTTYKVENIKS